MASAASFGGALRFRRSLPAWTGEKKTGRACALPVVVLMLFDSIYQLNIPEYWSRRIEYWAPLKAILVI